MSIINYLYLNHLNYRENICTSILQDTEGDFYTIMPVELEFCKKWGLLLSNIH